MGFAKIPLVFFLAIWYKEHIWFALPKGVGVVHTFKDFVKILNRKVYSTKGCKGYYDLLEDVKLMKRARSNQGKASALANIWMKRICEMNSTQLKKLANNYKKGDMDPYKFNPEYKSQVYDEKHEKEQEDEEIL